MKTRLTKEIIRRFNEVPFAWDIACSVFSSSVSNNNGFVGTLMLGYSNKTLFLYNSESDTFCAIGDGDVIVCQYDLKKLVNSSLWKLVLGG